MIEISPLAGELPTRGVVVACIGTDGAHSDAARRLDELADGRLGRAVALAGTLKHGSLVDVVAPTSAEGYERIVLLALGKPEGLSRLDLEEAGAGLVQKLQALNVKEAAVATTTGLETGHAPAAAAAALALGAMLRSYAFRKYKTKADEPETHVEKLAVAGLDAPEADSVRAQAAAVALARDLVGEPANVLYPQSFAERCLELQDLGIEVEILGPDDLERLHMRALLGVGQGSERPPYVVVMRWQGGAAGAAPLALVGKGVCFDTGGISIKPAAGMEEMKWDMGGAAAVVGAMRALAGRKAKANVVGVIGLAENMPSGTAQRPGDVVTAMSGTTIEVINTDAEGRLLLADVLWYTHERFKPKAIVDLATLTGAVIVALGHENAGLFANRDDLAAALAAAGAKVGEGLWRLPLGPGYDKHIKSDIADIKNVGRAREAGATAGAVFLQRFIGDCAWAHLDIAGVAWTNRDLPLAGKGGTGFGVRLLDQLVADQHEGAG